MQPEVKNEKEDETRLYFMKEKWCVLFYFKINKFKQLDSQKYIYSNIR